MAWFITELKHEFELPDSQLTVIWGGALVFAALVMPFAGKAIDSFGPRRILMLAGPAFGSAVALMGSVDGVPSLVVVIGIMRFLGPNLVLCSASKAINVWFVQKRGRIGVLLVASFYTMLLLPTPVSRLIASEGWRAAYRVCGTVSGVGICLLAVLLLREDGPDGYGLRPDGERGAVSDPDKEKKWRGVKVRMLQATER